MSDSDNAVECDELEYTAPIWHPYNETETKKVEKVQKTAARWVCRRWHNKSSVGDMLNDLDWPSLEDRRLKSSFTFFYKIHSGTVSLDKDKYLTPAPRLRTTRAYHDSQYTRYMSYSDALKNSFFPRTIPFDGKFSNVNQVIYFSAPTSIPNMNALAQTLFEISCTQDFKILFSKGHNSEKGHNSDMKKKIRVNYFFMRNLYTKFQIPSMHHLEV